MSDKEEEETKSFKRSAVDTEEATVAENQETKDEDDSDDNWIGPMPTEAVQPKKRKGSLSYCIILFIIFQLYSDYQFWNMRSYTWTTYQTPNVMRKVICIVILLLMLL